MYGDLLSLLEVDKSRNNPDNYIADVINIFEKWHNIANNKGKDYRITWFSSSMQKELNMSYKLAGNIIEKLKSDYGYSEYKKDGNLCIMKNSIDTNN